MSVSLDCIPTCGARRSRSRPVGRQPRHARRGAVSSAGRPERVRERCESSRRADRRRGPWCGNSSRIRELPKKFAEKRGAPLAPAAAGRSAGLERDRYGNPYRVGSSTRSSHPASRRGDRKRPSPVGRVGAKRFPMASSPGCIARLGRPVLRRSERIALNRSESLDGRPPRCIPRRLGAASRDREIGPAPSEVREDPAASNRPPSPLPSEPALRLLACRSIPQRRGRSAAWLAFADPRCGVPRYTR